MKKFWKMLGYDLKMTLREREALFWMFLFPVLMMTILGFVFGRSGEIRLNVGVVDNDRTAASGVIVGAFRSIGSAKDNPLNVTTGTRNGEIDELKDGDRDGVLVIRRGFQGDFSEGRPGRIDMFINESEVTTAQITRQTLIGILSEIESRMAERSEGIAGRPELIEVREEHLVGRDFDYLDFMVPGILAMTIMFAGLMGYAEQIASYREKGILRRVKVSPLSLPAFLGSGITSMLVFSLIQAVVLTGIGVLAFKIKIAGNYLYIAILVTVGSLAFLSIGFMISSLVRTSKSSALAANAVALPMMFLSGIFFPLEFVPAAFSVIARCLPLYYFGHALREVMINGAGLARVWVDFAVLLGFGFVCFAVSVRFFRWE